MELKNKLNVLFLSHEGDLIGGSTESLINLINSLGSKINPIVIIPSKGEACNRLKELGIPYKIVPFKLAITDKSGVKRLITLFPRLVRDLLINQKAISKIRSVLGNVKIDIVHSNSAVIGIGNLLSKKLSAKHVWHLREFQNLDFGLNPLLGWKYLKEKVKKSDSVICISKSISKHYEMQHNPKSVIIYDAIRKEKDIAVIKPKEDYLLFAGKVSKSKGIEDALYAFTKVLEIHENLKFVIAGNVKDDYLSFLTDLLVKLKIKDNVKFVGFQKDVNGLMSKAICLLMCSKNEGLGRVTVEAMFNGCPVVGYANAGTEEIINHQVTGLLYKTNEELVNSILFNVNNKDVNSPLLLNAQKYALDNFTEEVYSKRIFEFYNSLCKEK